MIGEVLEMSRKIDELKEERYRLAAENAALAETLKLITKHYEHPLHDHNWAYWTNEQANKALSQLSARTKAVMGVVEAARKTVEYADAYADSYISRPIRDALQSLDGKGEA